MQHITKVVIVGGGSAGFMAALALKLKLPQLNVLVIRSPEIGIIGVGEGSTPPFTQFIHEFLGISVPQFVRATQPGLKTGTCFLWGPRPKFFFPLGIHIAVKPNGLPRPIGYYLDHGDADAGCPASARMQANRPFGFNPKGALLIDNDYAYHIENDRFTAFFESTARSAGVEITDGTIEQVFQDDHGITAVHLSDGRSISGDLYVDCSGFRSLLLGQTLKEPRVEYTSTLACNRAVVGGWSRPPGEPMLSYTLSETMNAGWCWRIDHPDRINRGYVYSSAFISDDEAEKELRAKNPLIGPTRIVKFTSGRFNRCWVKNVVAIGNASGFVEPLEATSLAIIAKRSMLLSELLIDADCMVGPPMHRLFNDNTASIWDAVRDFLSLHYRFNTRINTPFWQHCRADTDLANAKPVVDYYQHAGPSPSMAAAFVSRVAVFGANSYLTILTGQQVPTHYTYRPTAAELGIWHNWCRANAAAAQSAATTEQSLAILAGGRQLSA
jgi:tryptophan halogenase